MQCKFYFLCNNSTLILNCCFSLQEREVKPISPAADAQHNGVNDLAAALSRALAERNRVIHPDDDDDDESSDSNDEWDD